MPVLFEFTCRRNKKHKHLISDRYARNKAIKLAEDVLVDKISNVTYTVIYEDGTKEETKALDYYNDII